MNGYEHYQRAEDLMAQATATRPNPAGIEVCYVTTEEQERLTRIASVHATLALAAATADASNFKRALYRGNGEELPANKRESNKADRAAARVANFTD